MKSRKIIIYNFLVMLYVALFPIIPDYFRVNNIPFSYYFSFIIFVLTSIFSILIRDKLKMIIRIVMPLILVALVSFLYFKEAESLLGYIVSCIFPIYIVFNYIDTKEDIDRIIKILCSTGLIMCISAIIERTTSFNVFSLLENYNLDVMGSSQYIRDGLIRVEQSFGHAIPFAIYLSMINIISFYKIKESPQKKLYLITFILSLICCFLTVSRMPFIVLVLCEFLMFFRHQKNRIITIIVCFMLIVITNLILDNAIVDFVDKYYQLVNGVLFSKQELNDVSSLYRLKLIPTLAPYIKEHLMFGYGNITMRTFRFSMFGYTYYSIDNAFLSVLMYHGLGGLFMLLYPLIMFGIYSIKLIKRKENIGGFFLILAFCYLLNLFSVAQMGEKSIFYILFGIILSVYYLAKRSENI